jgi:flagellar biosynthesis protein FlgN
MAQSINFTRDAQLLSSLLAELNNEQKALINQDIELIESIMNKRLTLLQDLSATAKSRYDNLMASGFQANEQGMKDWLTTQKNEQLNQAWALFQKSLAHAKELNRLNGILINKHVSRNQEKLNLLHGDKSKTQVYGKNGQAKSQQYLRNALAV